MYKLLCSTSYCSLKKVWNKCLQDSFSLLNNSNHVLSFWLYHYPSGNHMLHTYGNQLCSESNMCENSIGREYVQVANWQVAKCPVTFQSHQIMIILISTVIQLIGNHFSLVKKKWKWNWNVCLFFLCCNRPVITHSYHLHFDIFFL